MLLERPNRFWLYCHRGWKNTFRIITRSMYEVFIGDEPFKLLYSNDRTKSSWADPFINLCRLPGGMKPWCCLASKPKCQIVPNLREGSQRLLVHHLHALEADGCLVDNQKWEKCLAPAGACGVPCGNAHWAPRRWCYHGFCIAGCSVSTGSRCIPFSRFSDPHWKLDQTSKGLGIKRIQSRMPSLKLTARP